MRTDRSIEIEPLTAASYVRFGDVIAAHGAARPANQGTAQKSDHLAELVDRPGSRANVSVFRCTPRPLPHVVALLEKHPASTQIFVPMNAERYLVIVALGEHEPDLATLRAFVAEGQQAISYRPGVWHHPMVALERETDFFCLVFEDGTDADCVEHAIPPEARVTVR